MSSLRLRLSLWFGLSFLAVTTLFVAVAYRHLDHELRTEQWQRVHPDHPDWVLHGSFSDAEVREIVGELMLSTLAVSGFVVVIALGVGYQLARHSTRPVSLLNTALRQIGPNNLAQRLTVAEADPEVRAIAEQINALLARLEHSFRDLTEFSAKVAHELRTPLTLMRLQVEQAAGKIEPGLSDALQDELARLSDYVDQSLLIAQAELGRLVLHVERLDLGALVTEMSDVYQMLAASEERRIELRCAPGCWVRADPKFLRQMLHNLLTNALKHGQGTIVVRVGVGPSEVRCSIVNPVRDTQSGNPPGIGLGLRIVTALAAQHPGIRFERGTGPGEFVGTLTFPRADLPGRQD